MPKIGLLSDTHGRALATRRAAALLVQAGAQRLLHLGDVGGPAVLDELVLPAPAGSGRVAGAESAKPQSPDPAQRRRGVEDSAPATRGLADTPARSPPALLPVHLVFGNIDADAPALARYAAHLGLLVAHPVGCLALPDGRELVFLHGDDRHALAAALARRVAYLCHGHTHRAADTRRGPTRVLNPGALYRAPVHTVALLDTDSDAVQFFTVETG